MERTAEAARIAEALRLSIGLLLRRLRQPLGEDDLTMPETAALARLERGGPTTSAALAKLEQISPQSMGATLSALRARGFVVRKPDPLDGRQSVVSIAAAGLKALRSRRGARTEKLAHALSTGFTTAELKTLAAAAPLLERLAQNIL